MGKNRIQLLVLATASVALLLAIGAVVYKKVALPQPVVIPTAGYPRLGAPDAKIRMVLFEDFRCCACRVFSQVVLPEIEKRYIETGEASCVLIPLAFLHGSKPLANAALAVYHLAPDRFFAYVHALFDAFGMREIDGSERRELLLLAAQIGGIDLMRLRTCIETNCYFGDLDRNLERAKEIMGRDFGAPALFVNGVPTSTASIDAVAQRIEQLRGRP